MAVRITTLSENSAEQGGFIAEWGLSVLVETQDENILLDTGNRGALIHNADLLDLDLSMIDKIVLSHGHFDHTGGLRELLIRLKKPVEIIAHPDIWQEKLVTREEAVERRIGIPFQQAELESLGARFVFSREPVSVGKNMLTTGEVPMTTGFEQIDEGFFVKNHSGLQPDSLMDDLALIVKTKLGLIVVLGCAHRGIINTLYHARNISGIEDIHMVIGGSHLMNVSEERLRKTIIALDELGVERMGLCHCTEKYAAERLAQEFGDKFFFNKAGTILQIS